MKVALIQCPVWGTYDPPLALAQLSACLKKEGHRVFCFDINIGLYLKRTENYKNMWAWEQCLFWYDQEQVGKFFADNKEQIEEYIDKIIYTDAKLICFSVSSSSRLFSLKIAAELKKKKSDLIIVFGGPLFFKHKFIDAILEENIVDNVVPGEGELALCDLIKFIEKDQDIAYCPGLFFKSDGKITNSGSRALIQNLDTLPFLDFSDLPLDDYDDATHVPFMSSRGCVQNCIFCSSKIFWPGYRSMSGERIFQEVKFHKDKYNIGHVDFLDLLFNGNMKSLITFCELMSDANLDLHWTANMIIRPEMTPEVLKRLKRAGCEHIIYGIESGSQRILNLMRKHYKIEDADKVIRATHEADIVVTANFMFGFPGETQEDFKLTLEFIKRNAKFLDRVYPSRTFCALEEFSYFHSHLEEFGIVPNSPNHLYWESMDGANNYPERLRRCEIFCDLASSLGIEVGCGVQTSVELDKWHNLANYYEFKKDYKEAVDCYLRYFELDPSNEPILNKLKFYYNEMEECRLDLSDDRDLANRLMKAMVPFWLATNDPVIIVTERIKKLGRDKSLVLMKTKSDNNFKLNEEEYQARKTILKSSPREFIFQVDGPSNSDVVFSLGKKDYELFNLEIFKKRFEERIFFYIASANSITFLGWGEFLLLPEIEDILDYFDDNFPNVEKIFFTDGLALSPQTTDKLVKNDGIYTINVSLSASNSKLYSQLNHTDNFHKILGYLNYTLKSRGDKNNFKVNIVFTVTTLNIEDLPKFIVLASNLGVDKVICRYNSIYTSTQKYISCFFKQELTNTMFGEAEQIANWMGLTLELSPRFGLNNYSTRGLCQVPWTKIMFNFGGFIPPCQELEDCYEDFGGAKEGKWLMDIWNGFYYQNLRKSLIEGIAPCFKYCLRANPQAVNDFRSHIIRRGSEKEKIDVGNF